MIKKLILNDIRENRLMSAAAVFFMTASAMLVSLAVMLLCDLIGAESILAERSVTPDLMQMHSGEINEKELRAFVSECDDVLDMQICRFLNLANSSISLGGRSLADSTQDNGLSVQSERFDYMLGMDGRLPDVRRGQVFVPVCYKKMYGISVGDIMTIGEKELVIAGFMRDPQMNSMLASSKRFLVNAEDYAELYSFGDEEYMIEFLLTEAADINTFSTAYAEAGLPSDGPAVTKPLIGMMNALSDGIMIIIIFLAGAAVLLISLLCIRFILLIQTERDKDEICTLKALGIAGNDIKRLYFSKYLAFSVFGAAAGVAAAFILRIPLGREIRELYGSGGNGVLSCSAAVIFAAAAEVILLLAVGRIISGVDGLSPAAAMLSERENHQKGLAGQYLLTGFVAAVCMFMTLVPQNLYTTVSAPDFASYMGIGDSELRIDVNRTEDIGSETDRLAAALRADRDVRIYSVLRTFAVTAEIPGGTAVSLSVETGDHGLFPVKYSEGRYPEKDGEIALSSINSKELGLGVGDSLYIVSDGKKQEFTVCGIYSDITNGGKTAKAYSAAEGKNAIRSVIYVSLADSADRSAWEEHYRVLGADVTDIADYIAGTYGQTLAAVRSAAKVSAVTAAAVTAVVVMLFIRLAAEKERFDISLKKALGFGNDAVMRSYFIKGMLPIAAGTAVGIFFGNVCGGRICGACLKLFGADSFSFVTDTAAVYLILPLVILCTSAAAVLMGISPIKRISAFECCYGKE